MQGTRCAHALNELTRLCDRQDFNLFGPYFYGLHLVLTSLKFFLIAR